MAFYGRNNQSPTLFEGENNRHISQKLIDNM